MKLNAQTSWNVNTINELSEEAKNTMVNFNSVTTTLDNCIQIYSLRVDSLTENAHKLYQVFSASTQKNKPTVDLEKKQKKQKKSGESYLVDPKTITMETIENKGAWMMPQMDGKWSDIWNYNNLELEFNIDSEIPERSDALPAFAENPTLDAAFDEFVHPEWPYLPSLSEFVGDNVPAQFQIISEMGEMPFWYSEIDMDAIKKNATEAYQSMNVDEPINDAEPDFEDNLPTVLPTDDVKMSDQSQMPQFDEIEPYVEIDQSMISHLVINNEEEHSESPSLVLDVNDANTELLWQTNQNWAGPMHYKVIKSATTSAKTGTKANKSKSNFEFVEYATTTEATSGASLIKEAFVQLKSTPKSVVLVPKEALLLPSEDFDYGNTEFNKSDYKTMQPYERIQLNRLWMFPISINTFLKRTDSKLEEHVKAPFEPDEDLFASADYPMESSQPVDDVFDAHVDELQQPPMMSRIAKIPAVTNVQQIKNELVTSIHKQENQEMIKLTEIVDRGAIERGDVQLSTLFVCLLHLAVENEWDLTTDDQNEVYVNSHEHETII